MTCDALRDLLPFVQFKKREMHPWMSFTFSKVTGFYNFTQTNTPSWVFYTFLNCTNGSKSLKASHIYLNWNSHKKKGHIKNTSRKLANIYLFKVAIETLEKGVKYVQS